MLATCASRTSRAVRAVAANLVSVKASRGHPCGDPATVERNGASAGSATHSVALRLLSVPAYPAARFATAAVVFVGSVAGHTRRKKDSSHAGTRVRCRCCVTLRMVSARATYPVFEYSHFSPGAKRNGTACAAASSSASLIFLFRAESGRLANESGCVGEQMTNRDRAPTMTAFCRGDLLIDALGCVEADALLLDKQHDAGRNELLADRTYLVDRLARRRNLVVAIGEPVAFGFDDLPVSDDRQR